MHVEGLGVAVVVRSPDAVDQHVARQHPAGVGEEQLQELELLEREGNPFAAHRNLVASGVETHRADLEHFVALCIAGIVATTAPQRGPHPRDQLAEPERLGHVVVGADLEPDHRVDLRVARRDHDDRDL